MRFSHILPLAALGTAFVLPNTQVFNDLSIDGNTHARVSKGAIESVKEHFAEAENTLKHATDDVRNALDDALASASRTGHSVNDKIHETAFDAQSWFDSASNSVFDAFEGHENPPHGRPPHHGPDHDEPPHHGKPPHHKKPHHHEPNQTVYELISQSKYTTKFAKLINEYPDLVKSLNGTKANFTVFAPTDEAFPDHPHHKPSKEEIKEFIEYHISPDFYPAGRVLVTHTVPTLLKGEHLPVKDTPQRLSINIGLKGLTLNHYSRVVAINIFGTNGVIHGIDSLLIPPPKVIKIISLLPSEFSTLELALSKTGLTEHFEDDKHPGGTLFAPSNFAFAKLGPKINAFLFSDYGLKYLKALILYHSVPNHVLYSDAYYKAESVDHGIPKGHFHVDLPTALDDRSLSIDIGRYGGFIDIKINAFSRVVVQDGIAQEGVIQVVGDVLIPPKKLGGVKSKWSLWESDEEMTVEEFKERFESAVERMIDL